ncbi:MAG: hypothetical protein ACYTHJ_05235 [Planctomycetota bacterium]
MFIKNLIRAIAVLHVGLSFAFLVGCPGVIPDSLPDMTTPAPCSGDADCPDGIACIFPNGEDQGGICDVDETQVTTGAPAPCTSNQDCPDGVIGVLAREMDTEGFCDIEETRVSPGDGNCPTDPCEP